MKVTLLHNSPLWLASNAIRMSHDNHDKSDTIFNISSKSGMYIKTDIIYGYLDENTPIYQDEFIECEAGIKDKALIARVGNKMKHKSVLEQLVYWFDIDGISRACLQELARHRTARLTVKSSRYTLNELKITEDSGLPRFLVHTPDSYVNSYNLSLLSQLKTTLICGTSNDIAKYMLPEAFKTRLQWQVDGRNLQNFLALRTSKDALWEIQLLARAIYNELPSEHKYLYSEYIMDSTNPSVVGDTPETTV